jgi:hypothetical protein
VSKYILYGGILLGVSLIGGISANTVLAEQTVDVRTFLKDEIGLSQKDLKKLEQGQVITIRTDTDTKVELALFSIARIDVPKAFFVRHYEENGMNIETAAAEAGGLLHNPPQPDDIKSFELPPGDLKELSKCQVGKCHVKMPAASIEALRQFDPSDPEYQEQINRAARQAMLDYVNAYLQGGDVTLAEYHDKQKPTKVAEQFRKLLKDSPLYTYVPELQTYLQKFPCGELSNTKNVLYWMQENFGGKAKRPIISINHVVFYRPNIVGFQGIIASKQLYATHYYEAALGLTIMADLPGKDASGFYLIHSNRAMIDILREIPGFLAGKLFKGAQQLLHTKMSTVKANMEALYQAETE